MPSWAPPCAVAGCLICTVPISTSSQASPAAGMMGYGEVHGVAEEVGGKEAGEDQLLFSPPRHALQLCLKALARSRAGGGTP